MVIHHVHLLELMVEWYCITTSHIEFIPEHPQAHNLNDVEVALTKAMNLSHMLIIAIHRLPKVAILQLCSALNTVHNMTTSQFNIILRGF